MCSINDLETLTRLHISTLRKPVVDENELAHELQLLRRYSDLCIEISSARCWSQCQYMVCLPNVFCLVHHEEMEQRRRGLKLINKIWTAVLHAERFLQDSASPADVKLALASIMTQMAWNKNQVAREIYLVCNAARWDPHDNEVRQMAFQLFGNPGNTKHFLEDAFSHLADVAKRFARHSKMSKILDESQTLFFSFCMFRGTIIAYFYPPCTFTCFSGPLPVKTYCLSSVQLLPMTGG